MSLQLTGNADPIPQTWVIGDEDKVFNDMCEFIDAYGITDVVTWGCPPGFDPEQMNESFERFASGVLPRLRERY